MLNPTNHITCCPPGKLQSPNELQHVVVASMMRSGTHIVIDIILNNFVSLRKQPLYVNLDTYLNQGGDINMLDESGGTLVKTHYPQTSISLANNSDLGIFLQKCKVILVKRASDQMKKSLANFGELGKKELASFDESFVRHTTYWRSHSNYLTLHYDDLIDANKLEEIIVSISNFLELPIPAHLRGPRCKDQRWRIKFDKALTRLLGPLAPRINTGIGLGS